MKKLSDWIALLFGYTPEVEEIEEIRDKVFCCNCKFHYAFYIETCDALSNEQDTYYAPREGQIVHPSEKNKDNDCKDYMRKGSDGA